MTIFSEMESTVQSYARSFPTVFETANGSYLHDIKGNAYIDFLAGAGSLNYGHNNPILKQALVEYIMHDGVAHSLDMHTKAKADFIGAFRDYVLKPRDLDYRLQFTGPTGANTVEAAFKLARKVTGHTNIIAFTNGFHGVTAGALAATGNQHHRGGAGLPLGNVTRMPFCGYHGRDADTLKMMDKLLSDPSAGIDAPAAVIVETVQGEGGLNIAEAQWLQGLEKLCRKHEMLLIVDDIQAGCGRTGTFFSFEPSGIKPDLVTLSKSLSGFGLPMALLLLKPELDIWRPGEHNGTFRGNNHAFITAATALQHYWKDDSFAEEVRLKGELIGKKLREISDQTGVTQVRPKGRGMMRGLECANSTIAEKIARTAFTKNLIIETSGNRGQVLKCLCPLTISESELTEGLESLAKSVFEVFEGNLSKAS